MAGKEEGKRRNLQNLEDGVTVLPFGLNRCCSNMEEEEDAAAAAGGSGFECLSRRCPPVKRKAEKEPSGRRKAAAAAGDGGSKGDKATAAGAGAGEVEAALAPARPTPMNAVDYIVAHKRLPQREIDFILMEQRTRTPFTDTREFSRLSADPSATEEDLAAAAAEHEAQQERSIKFQDFVRRELMARGEVVIDDEYIARRVEIEEYSKAQWVKAFAGIDMSNFADTDQDEGDEFEFEAHSTTCEAVSTT